MVDIPFVPDIVLETLGLKSKNVSKTFGALSSWISSMEWDADTGNLDITTHKGRTFTHYKVPEDVATAFAAAGSPGEFWHSNIKGLY